MQSGLVTAVAVLLILVLYVGFSNTTSSKRTSFFDKLHSLFD